MTLTPQDRTAWRPHVTVQNKVAPEDARRTWRELEAVSYTAPIWAEGVALWRYRGGPWQNMEAFAFSRSGSAA